MSEPELILETEDYIITDAEIPRAHGFRRALSPDRSIFVGAANPEHSFNEIVRPMGKNSYILQIRNTERGNGPAMFTLGFTEAAMEAIRDLSIAVMEPTMGFPHVDQECRKNDGAQCWTYTVQVDENQLKAAGVDLGQTISVVNEHVVKSLEDRVNMAVELAGNYGSTDGAHHKMWVIDQMVRILSDDRYEDFVAAVKHGDEGPETYEWDEGIAP